MRKRSMPLAVGLFAAASLAAAVSASANRLSISAAGIRVTWEALTFYNEEATQVSCPVTLEGSLHSLTIQKVQGQLIGHVTRAAVGRCSSGTSRILVETLPWHILYQQFSGVLPNVTNIQLAVEGMSFSWSNFVTCLYRTGGANPPALFNASRNPTTRQIVGFSGAGIPNWISGTGAFCFGGYPIYLRGNGAVHRLGTTEGVFVVLI